MADIPAGGCGLPPYDWVPTDTMGEVFEWEPVGGATIPRDALRALLELQNVDPEEIQHGIRTWRVRYRTQDRGVPVEATALVSAPDDVFPGEPLPTLLWMHPTYGFSDACSPTGNDLTALATVGFAGAGFVLIAPDYLGLKGMGEPSGMLHPYVVPEPTAVASLDAVRALENLREELVLPESNGQTIVWGASEGGAAALWADRYAPYYLPELEITGVVAAVPPTDAPGLSRASTAQPSDATLGSVFYLATNHDWYQVERPLSEVIVDTLAEQLPELLQTSCSLDLPVTGDEEVEDILTPAFVAASQSGDFGALEPWGCILDKADLGSSVIPRLSDAPVMMIVGEMDTLVTGSVERAHAPVLCETGYELEYLECTVTDHTDTAFSTWDEQFAWVKARLRGEPLPAPCVIGEPVACE